MILWRMRSSFPVFVCTKEKGRSRPRILSNKPTNVNICHVLEIREIRGSEASYRGAIEVSLVLLRIENDQHLGLFQEFEVLRHAMDGLRVGITNDQVSVLLSI